MNWISLVCLLALSSSAFANYGLANGYGASSAKMNTLLNTMRDNTIRRPMGSMGPAHHHHHRHHQQRLLDQPTYGQQVQLPSQSAYGSSFLTAPKTLPTQGYGQMNQGYGQMSQGYGAASRALIPEQPQPQPVVLTEADQLCIGQAPETVIPVDEGRRFVVCLADSKGTEQSCPKGLFYHLDTQRCERKFGPTNYCASQPCLNGGQCILTDSSYKCQCAEGFDGQNCEKDSRICETQRPCGDSPGARCQSFRLGAALTYVCIFEQGQAYGISALQAVTNPCQGIDGPHALSTSNAGFIMCDGDRMHIESCPGGTIWDDNNKACVWPDTKSDVPQGDQSDSYGSYGSYGQSRQLINKPTYGGLERPKLVSNYGSQLNIQRPVFEQSKLSQGYGSQIMMPAVPERKIDQGFSSQLNIQRPVFEQPKLNQGYGSQINIQRPVFEQPKLSQGYGSQIIVPSIPEQKLDQGFSSQITLQRPVLEQPKLNQGYGSQMIVQSVPEQKLDQGFSSQITLQRPVLEQPKLDQGFGSQINIQPPVPEQLKVNQGYGY